MKWFGKKHDNDNDNSELWGFGSMSVLMYSFNLYFDTGLS